MLLSAAAESVSGSGAHDEEVEDAAVLPEVLVPSGESARAVSSTEPERRGGWASDSTACRNWENMTSAEMGWRGQCAGALSECQ